MNDDIQHKLFKKKMTRHEFLQFMGGSVLVLFGLGNVIALMTHVKKAAVTESKHDVIASRGFGSRKFGA